MMQSTPKTIAFACAVAALIATPAVASHKSNVPPLDFAMQGVNAPGWTSLGDCENDRPGQGCRKIADCGSYALHTTASILHMVANELRTGRAVTVHSMSDSGHFIEKICLLQP